MYSQFTIPLYSIRSTKKTFYLRLKYYIETIQILYLGGIVKSTVFGMLLDILLETLYRKTKAYNKINNNISLSKLLCFCGIMLLRFQHFVVKTKHVFKSFKHQCATKSILSILRQDITSCPTYYSLSHHSKRGQSDLFIYLYYITVVPKSNKCFDTVFK